MRAVAIGVLLFAGIAQGGFLGIGRRVKPGDVDYNRGSLEGKTK